MMLDRKTMHRTLENEFENEYEYEGSGEFENEASIGGLAKLARQIAPILKKVAPIAASTIFTLA